MGHIEEKTTPGTTKTDDDVDLSKLLPLLRKHGVTEFADGTYKIALTAPPETAARARRKAKDDAEEKGPKLPKDVGELALALVGRQ